MPKYVTQAEVAKYLGVTTRTVRNLISRGVFTGYQIAGLRAVRLDMNEVVGKMQTVPAVRAEVHKKPFGPDANIVKVTPRRRAVVVDEAQP